MRRNWFYSRWPVLIWEQYVVLVHVGVYGRRTRGNPCRGKLLFHHSDVAYSWVESEGSDEGVFVGACWLFCPRIFDLGWFDGECRHCGGDGSFVTRFS